MPLERFTNDGATTLNGAITNVATSLVVTSATNFPTLAANEQFRLRVEDTAGGGVNLEYMIATATSGTTFTVTRGAESTTGVAHGTGSAVTLVVTAAAFASKANDSAVVHSTGVETVAGAKTFSAAVTTPDVVVQGLTGATATSRLVGATASGAPTSGTFAVGDVVMSLADGKWYTCTVAGTPGTWVTPAGGSSGHLLPLNKYVALKPLANDGAIPVKDREFCMGFLLAAQSIDRLSFYVSTVGEAGSVLRLGIRADADGSPGAAVVDVSTATSVGTGWKDVTVSRVHPGGILWVSWVSQAWTTTGPTIESSQANGVQFSTFYGPTIIPAAHRTALDFAAGNQPIVGYQDGVTGALGSTFTNAATSGQRLLSVVTRRSA